MSAEHRHHAEARAPGFSLIRLSVATRIAGASVLVLLVWLAVWSVMR